LIYVCDIPVQRRASIFCDTGESASCFNFEISASLAAWCNMMDLDLHIADPAADLLDLMSVQDIPLEPEIVIDDVSKVLPVISVSYGPGLICRALCDTGASVSIMTQDCFENISKLWAPEQWTVRQMTHYPRIRGVTGKMLIPIGRFILAIRIENQVFANDFLIIETVTEGPLTQYGVVLGIDFMRRHNFTIHCGGNVIEIQDKQITIPCEAPVIEPTLACVDYMDVSFISDSDVLDIMPISEVIIPPSSSADIRCRVASEYTGICSIPSQEVNSIFLYVEAAQINCTESEFMARFHNTSNQPCYIGAEEVMTLHADSTDPLPVAMPSEMADALSDEERTKEWNRVVRYVLDQSADLSPKEKSALESLIRAYPDVFRLKTDPPGCIKSIEVSVQLTTCNPIYVRQYPLPACDMEEVEKQVSSFLKHRIISPTASPYNSPLLVVPKKDVLADGTLVQQKRMCIDVRRINLVTPELKFPSIRIDEALSMLRGNSRFSSVDFLNGFFQLPLAPNSKRIFAFTVSSGRYHFERMPFGWINAPAWMQNFIMVIFVARLAPKAQGYMDDLIIHTKSTEEHFQTLKKTLDIAREENAAFKLSKCEFFSNFMLYLGHIITAEGIRMDPKKNAAVQGINVPKNQKELRSFLGSAQYVAKFILNFSARARALFLLLRKDVPFIWGPEQQAAFEDIKAALREDVVLVFPDPEKEYVIITDASQYAIGAYLAQEDQGILRPIWCLSRALNRAEIRYSTIEKELLAIVFALQRFRPYVYGHRFKVVTDHRPLIWLCGLNKPSSRLSRWSLQISEYAGKVEFVPGKENRVADALSRPPFCPDIEEEAPPLEGPLANPDLDEEMKKQILSSTLGMETMAILEADESDDDSDLDGVFTPVLLPEFWVNSVPKNEIPAEVYTDPHNVYWYSFVDSQGISQHRLWVCPAYRTQVMENFHEAPFSANKSACKMADQMAH